MKCHEAITKTFFDLFCVERGEHGPGDAVLLYPEPEWAQPPAQDLHLRRGVRDGLHHGGHLQWQRLQPRRGYGYKMEEHVPLNIEILQTIPCILNTEKLIILFIVLNNTQENVKALRIVQNRRTVEEKIDNKQRSIKYT